MTIFLKFHLCITFIAIIQVQVNGDLDDNVFKHNVHFNVNRHDSRPKVIRYHHLLNYTDSPVLYTVTVSCQCRCMKKCGCGCGCGCGCNCGCGCDCGCGCGCRCCNNPPCASPCTTPAIPCQMAVPTVPVAPVYASACPPPPCEKDIIVPVTGQCPCGNQPSFCVQSVVVGKEDTEKKKRKKIKCPDEYDPSEISEEAEESEELSDHLTRHHGRRRFSRSHFYPEHHLFGGRDHLCGSLFHNPLLCARLHPYLDHFNLPFF